MSTIWSRLKMGISAGYKAFSDPESLSRDMTIEQRRDIYTVGWDYYRNRQFSRRDGRDWSYYLAHRDLYKHTRLIYNPVPQIVDFYVDNIWQPAHHQDFEALVTPLSDKADEQIMAVVEQLDQWSNWLSESQKIKRYAAAAGNVLVEGIDDVIRQKILHKTVWPGYVSEIELNATGDVLAYTLEYDVYDKELGGTYRYKKIVNKESFSYFRDDKPFVPEGKLTEVEANPYGFCFAVWLKHTDDGADYGLPACHSLDKVDEVNSLGSHLHDNIHKNIESPKIVSSDGEVLPIVGASKGLDGRLAYQDPRLNWVLFKTQSQASVHDLAGNLRLAEAHPYLKDALASFTDDYPELQAAAVIKENSQLSGAALERLLTPAQNRLDGVQANYNQQLIKLRQMQIAVGGMRVSGGWLGRTEQKDAFRPFNLQSYERGDLNFNLNRSLLIQPTEAENEELLLAKANRAVTLENGIDAQEFVSIAGFSEDDIKDIQARQKAEDDAEPDVDPAVADAMRLANGGVLPRQLPAGAVIDA